MSESQSDDTAESQSYLINEGYGDLMNLARSMNEQFDDVDIETNAPKKGELVEALEPYEVDGDRDSGWSVEIDGSRHDVELLEVQTPDEYNNGSTGPTDSTILYGLTRSATTEERIQEIDEALRSETDYEVRESDSDKYMIVLPAENQEGYVEPSEDEADEDEESEESGSDEEADSSETESEGAESDSEDDEGESEAEEEESADEASEGDEEDEELLLDPEVVRERLEDKTKDELYDMAVDHDIDGRTKMNKQELVENLLEVHPEVADE